MNTLNKVRSGIERLRRMDKDDLYLMMLTTTGFLENAKGNFFYDVTDYNFDPETRLLTIEGWAFTREDEVAVDYKFLSNRAEVVSFERTEADIPIPRSKEREGERLGFRAVLRLPEGTTENHEFPLVLTDKKTGQMVKLLARDDMHYHYSPSDFFDYYLNVFRTRGLKGVIDQYRLQQNHIWDAYNQWYHSKPGPDPEAIKKEIEAFEKKPLISIVVPVYDVDEVWLRKMIDSVRDQYYENWELCLADDHSSKEHVKKVLNEYAAADERIKVVFRDENGHISEATNSALSLATGDYIGFMDHDDEIEPDTLYEYVKAINEEEPDLIYCDQDFVDTENFRYEPFYKSHWNPRLLMSQNYISHFLLVSRELLDKTGWLRKQFDGSQDYDFVLRASLKADKIHHIPKILYHWRVLEGSVANDPEVKEYAYKRASAAISNYLKKKNMPAKSVVSQYYGINTIVREDEPLVSVIILDDGSEYADQTLKAVLENTDYQNYEVLAVNFDQRIENEHVRYLTNNAPKTRYELYDYAAERADGELLTFIEPGATPKNPNWLTVQVNETADPDTGIVGGFILDQEDGILNAGVAFDTASDQLLYCHRGAKLEPGFLGYYFRLIVPQNVVSVSSVAMTIPKALFTELGGFDKEYDRPLSDLDLSLRAMRKGKRTVWTPDSQIVWNAAVEDYQTRFDTVPTFYMEALPAQVEPFLEEYSEEELRDPYTNDLINRFRRHASPNYNGSEEYRNV